MAKFNSRKDSDDKGRSGRSREDRPGRKRSTDSSEEKKDGYKAKRSFSKNKVFRTVKEEGNSGPRRSSGSDDRKPFKKDYSSDKGGERKPFKRDFKDSKDGPKRGFKSGSGTRNPYSEDKEKRSSGPSEERRSFRDDREKRSDSPRKPFRERDKDEERSSSDRPRRSFNDDNEVEKAGRSSRPERSSDSPRKPFKERDRGEERSSSDRPRKSFNDDNEVEKAGRGSHPERSSDSPRKPFRERDENSSSSDRPRRSFSDEKEGRSSRPERSSKPREFKKDKFDGFKNAGKPDTGRTSSTGDKKKRFSKPRRNDADEGSKRVKYDDFEEGRAFTKRGSDERPEKKAGPVRKQNDDGLIRLNKYLSNAGIASRRDADNLIQSGVVKVNSVVIDQLGYKINPGDKVTYGDAAVKSERKVYLLLNKPKDYITTVEDDRERKTVMELIRGACKERVYPVGRLDRNTTGLLLFTNDGELTTKLTHPKFGVKKVYHVSLNKGLKPDDFTAITEGIELEDGTVKADDLAFVGEGKKDVGIEIHSGRNRIVRRIFEQLGYDVIKLDRVVFAGLTKKDLPRGKHRFLTAKEISFLQMIG